MAENDLRETFCMNLSRIIKERNMTQRDFAKAVGVSAPTVNEWLKEKKMPLMGRIDKICAVLSIDRAELMGTQEPPAPAGRPAASESARKKGVRIPVLGRVVAGIPIEAVQEYDDWEEIPEEMARRGEYFALRVTGDSMKPVICNGDIIIVRIQPDVDTEQIAVVGVNGNEATVKKIIKDPHRHGITLYGYNAEVYQPTFYSEEEIETLPVTIYGLVVEARHKFI